MKDTGPQRARSKLVLPAPQVSEGELEELVKLGMAADGGAGDGRPTDGLLQEWLMFMVSNDLWLGLGLLGHTCFHGCYAYTTLASSAGHTLDRGTESLGFESDHKCPQRR